MSVTVIEDKYLGNSKHGLVLKDTEKLLNAKECFELLKTSIVVKEGKSDSYVAGGSFLFVFSLTTNSSGANMFAGNPYTASNLDDPVIYEEED